MRKLVKIDRRTIAALRIMDTTSPNEIKSIATDLKKRYKKVFNELEKL